MRAGAGTLALTLALAGWWWLDKPKGEGKVLATGCFLAALALAFFAVVPGPIVPVFRILGSVLGAL